METILYFVAGMIIGVIVGQLLWVFIIRPVLDEWT